MGRLVGDLGLPAGVAFWAPLTGLGTAGAFGAGAPGPRCPGLESVGPPVLRANSPLLVGFPRGCRSALNRGGHATVSLPRHRAGVCVDQQSMQNDRGFPRIVAVDFDIGERLSQRFARVDRSDVG